MCGIAGYIGPKNAVDVVYDQLKRLEYRGYDSAGVAFPNSDSLHLIKKAGKLIELGKILDAEKPESHIAMAHSRWATHGVPNDENSHPHYDQNKKIAVIHNGIIENYLDLREELIQKGHRFRSQTDTEVAAHVIGEEYEACGNLEEAVRKAVHRLRGAFALVVMAKDDTERLVAVRNASPIVLGKGEGENMLASDIPALLPYTREVFAMEQDTLAIITRDEIRVTDLDGREQKVQWDHVSWDVAEAERGGFEHFMLKEIFEQPQVIQNALAGRLDSSGKVRLENCFSDNVWNEVDLINIIACGTAYHAGLMGKYLIEKLLRIPVNVYYSSEFRYGNPVLSDKSLAVFVSQSGETADTLAALELCKSRGIRTLGIVNVMGSSIARGCDKTLFTQAGPEISVASTKAYTAQVIVMTLLTLHIAQVRDMPGVRVEGWVNELQQLDEKARKILAQEKEIAAMCEEFRRTPLCFFLGRGADAYTALEGALKLKEIAYIPTQEAPAGEMKHGPLALVQPGVLSIFGATDPTIVDKLISNMKVVKARGGTVVAIVNERDHITEKVADHVLRVPDMPYEFLSALLSIIPMQLIAYHVARLNGCEIDQPRNLAKSVTVE